MTDTLKCVKQKVDEAKNLIVARIQEIKSMESRTDEKSEGQKQKDGEHSTSEAKQPNKQLVPNVSSARQGEIERLKILLDLLQKATDICNADEEESHTEGKFSRVKEFFTTDLPSLFLGSPKTIQVLLKDQTPSTKVFMQELQVEVKGLKKKLELKFIDDVSKLQQHEKFIVVCPSSFRLEPDIDFSLQDIDKSKILAAVVLHQVRKGQEPAMSTQARIGQEEKYDGITFIDMAFNTDDKIYSCDMNKKAEHNLKAIVEKA